MLRIANHIDDAQYELRHLDDICNGSCSHMVVEERPGRSTEAIIVLSESIYRAWKGKKVYTALFMDAAGAFNNVHHNSQSKATPHTRSNISMDR